jgi:preprotein translocase subunit SecF
MKKYLLFILILQSAWLMACECPSLEPISKELAGRYEIIFIGKVDSVALPIAGISSVYFTIDELYKGHTGKQVSIDFDGSTSCMMSFAKGEVWIIYANYQRFDVISVNLCSHSRKQISGTQDFYADAAQRTFEQEQEFLKTTLGIQPFIEKETWNKEQQELKPRNEQPTAMNKMMLLLISFAAMILIYILTRKKKRKNGE